MSFVICVHILFICTRVGNSEAVKGGKKSLFFKRKKRHVYIYLFVHTYAFVSTGERERKKERKTRRE